jgi:hypothetical protein
MAQAASNFSSYFDKISEIFLEIRRYCPQNEDYQALYKDSTRLQAALCEYYATVVKLCLKIVEVSERPGNVSIVNTSMKTDDIGLKQFTMALMKPFEAEFGALKNTLRKQNDNIRVEASVASKQAAHNERLLQEAERKKNSLFRLDNRIQRKEVQNWMLQVERQRSSMSITIQSFYTKRNSLKTSASSQATLRL